MASRPGQALNPSNVPFGIVSSRSGGDSAVYLGAACIYSDRERSRFNMFSHVLCFYKEEYSFVNNRESPAELWNESEEPHQQCHLIIINTVILIIILMGQMDQVGK